LTTEPAKKKVLVISYYFPPMGKGSVLRPVKFMKYFQRFGWEAIAVTHTPRTYYTKDDYLLSELNIDGVRIYRTPCRGRRTLLTDQKLRNLPNEGSRQFFCKFRKAFKIPDPQIKWKKKAVRLAAEIIENEKIDIVFATAPPFTDLLIGYELKKKYGIPLVVDYRDSWLGSPDNFYPTRMHRFINTKKEVEVLKTADEVNTINRRIKELIIEKYHNITHRDIDIIPHCFDKEEFDSANTQLPRTNKMRFTHVGSFFGLVTPKYFIEGLSLVFKRRPELRSKIEACFIGLLSKENWKLIRHYGIRDVVYAPGFVNHKECFKYLLSSDVLWFMIGKGKGDELVSTIKLSEYIGARRPILACVPDGVAKQSLRFHDAVKICEPDDPEAIAKLILEYYELYEKNALPKMNEELLSAYDVEKQTYQLVRSFEFLLDIAPQVEFKEKKIVEGSSS
jgi:hypothetical protein